MTEIEEPIYRSLGTLGQVLSGISWPVDFFSTDDLPAFLDGIYVVDYRTRTTDDGFVLQSWLAFEGEISLGLPGFDGVKLVAGGGDVAGLTFATITLAFGAETYLTLDNVRLALRFDPSILKPAALNEGDPVPAFTEIRVEGFITIDKSFDITVEGFDALSVPPCMIGNSGIIIAADDVQLDLSRSTSPPEVLAAGFDGTFIGVYMGMIQVKLPDSLPELAPEDLVLRDAAIGTGGVGGWLEAHYSPAYEPATKTFGGKGAGDLFGIPFGLEDIKLKLKQNALEESEIMGKLLVPFFDEPVDVEVGIDLDGGFSVRLSSDDGLYTLTKADLFSMTLDGIGFEVMDGVFTATLSGAITPLFGAPALEWPTFAVKELSIDAEGNVRLEGGWLDLPEQYVLSFYGFQLEISKLGFGKADDGGNWLGFSGGLKLVDGLSAGASVEGLRVTWYEDGRDPKISLNGVGVEFEVPEVLRFKGAISYREFEQDGEMVRRFDGDIRLELTTLGLEIDAVLVVGVASDPVEGDYTFFAIYLGVELPAGIPLWSSGIALYGMAGLFAVQMEPDKRLDEPWYGVGPSDGWYKRPEIGVTDLRNKWTNEGGSFALGAGITLGTVADNGFTFSGRTLFAIVFPGPILLIEGKANILKERSKLSQEPLFRALAVLDTRAGTFLVGLDAQYRYGSGGELIEIRGGAEAFFDFTDPMAWHIYLGEKEPRERRIRAEILTLFEANAYLMLEAQQLAMGAWVGYDEHWNFGPLSVTLEGWIEGSAIISWKPAHFYGDLWLHGKAELSVFGFGAGLTTDARIAADVFDPFHVVGEFSVGINLPWPLPDLDVDITVEWGPTPTPPPLPLPLKEVAVEHFKVTTSWPVPRGQWLLPSYDPNGDGFYNAASGGSVPADLTAVPVVPLDARPHVTFGRAVHDDALVGVNPQPVTPAWERIGDPSKNEGPVRVRYGLKEVTLEKRNPSSGAWEAVARKGTTPNPSGVPTLYGSWAPVPALPSGEVAADTDPPVANIKLWLWSKTPFDWTRHTGGEWEEWFTDRFTDYPCIPDAPDREVCCDFEHLPTGPPKYPFSCPDHPEIGFYGNPRGGHVVQGLDPPVRGKTQALCFGPEDWLILGFRTPAKGAEIRLVPREQGRTERCVDFRDRQQVTGPNPLTEAGLTFEVLDFAGQPEPATRISAWGEQSGLDSGFQTNIALPSPASFVEVTLSHFVRPATVEALGARGEVLDTQSMTVGQEQEETLRLEAQGIRQVVIRAPQDETLLHQVCAGIAAAPGVTAIGADKSGKPHGPFYTQDDVVEVSVEELVEVRVHGEGETCLVEVCANLGPDPAEVVRRQEMAEHLVDELARWSQEGEVLEPHSTYRVKLVTTLEAQGEGDLSGYSEDLEMTEYAHFRTDGPPGLAALSTPVGHPNPEDFQSGLGSLTRYVRQTVPSTVPAPGEKPLLPRPVYRAYDVGAEFNEDYVDLMYRLERRNLGLYLYDSNNQPVRDAQGRLIVLSNRWGVTEDLTLTRSEDVWIRVIQGSDCATIDETVIPHDVTLTSAEEGQVLDPDTVYEARLVPLLLHEDFGGLAVGTIVTGPSGSLDGWTVHDEGSNGGASRWEIGEEGTPPSRYLVQTANTWGGTTAGTEPVKPGTLLLRADLPGLPADHPDQPGNWTDYRLSVFVRSEDNDAVGVVFRYQDASNFYRFSMDRERRYRRLVRVVDGVHTVLAEDDFVYQQDLDYLVTVEAVGPSLRFYQDRSPVFAVDDATFDTGRIGLYCWASEGARFTDVRVDDFRRTAPVVYRFKFTTSQFANFFHHLHSYQDETWRVDLADLSSPPSEGDIAALVGEANAAGSAPTAAERRAYDTLADHVLGPVALQNPPEVRVTRVERDGNALAFLVESPEPIDWARTDVALHRADRRLPSIQVPGPIKLTGGSLGATEPNGESVDLLLRKPTDLTGYRIEQRALPGPVAAPEGEPGLFVDRFEGASGLLFREEFGPSALDHYTVVDEGENLGPSAWMVSGGHIVQTSNLYGGSVTGSVPDKPGTVAVTGDPVWRDVLIRVSLRSEDNDAIGVVFRYQDPDNYYRFSMDRQRSYRRLVKKVGGAVTVLWEDGEAYQQGETYRLTLEAHRDRLLAYLDDALLFSLRDDAILGGQVGLYCWANTSAHFEALEVEALESDPVLWHPDATELVGLETVDAAGAQEGPSEWSVEDGVLAQTSNIYGADASPLRSGTYVVGGDPGWGDVRLSVRLHSDDNDDIGVLFRYQDDQDYYRFSMGRQGGYRRLLKLVGGVVTVLWEDALLYQVGQSYEVTLMAQGNELRGYLDGVLLYSVFDNDLRQGRVGLYCRANTGARFERVVMADATRRVGRWTVLDEGTVGAPSVWKLYRDALVQTSNIYTSAAPEYPGTFVVAGDAGWTDYRFSARLRSDDDDAIGLLFRYVDRDNYYRLSLDAQRSYRRLVRKHNGIVTTLWEEASGYQVGRWFTLTVEAVGSRLTGYLDGDRLFRVVDAVHRSGKVGLYCWGNTNARFDEVEVARPPLEAFALLRDGFPQEDTSGWSFVDEGTVSAPSAWAPSGGALRQMRNIYEPPDDRNTLSKQGAHAVAGDPAWTDVVLQARLVSHDDDAIGLLFRYQDDDNYYRFSMDSQRGYRRLVKNVGGTFSLLWEDAVAYAIGRSYEVTIVAVGGTLWGYLDGVPVFALEDSDLASGQVGLYCWANTDARFSRVRVYPADLAFDRWRLREDFALLVLDRWTFEDEGDQQGPSQWEVTGGELRQTSNLFGGSTDRTVPDKPGTQALAGDTSWTDYRLAVGLRSDGDDAIGVLFRYVDSDNYYRLSMDRQRSYRRLIKKVGGAVSVLWEDAVAYQQGREYLVTVDCLGPRLSAYLDGVRLFSVEDWDLASGRIGLYCWGNTGARFSRVRLAEPVWTSYFTFGREEVLPGGTRVKVLSGNEADAPPAEPGLIRRFVAGLDERGELDFPADGARLRVTTADGAIVHARDFLLPDDYAPVSFRLLRKGDGTGFYVVVPASTPAGTALPRGQYRLELTYRRDNRAADPESQVFSQAEDRSPEHVVMEVSWQSSN